MAAAGNIRPSGSIVRIHPAHLRCPCWTTAPSVRGATRSRTHRRVLRSTVGRPIADRDRSAPPSPHLPQYHSDGLPRVAASAAVSSSFLRHPAPDDDHGAAGRRLWPGVLSSWRRGDGADAGERAQGGGAAVPSSRWSWRVRRARRQLPGEVGERRQVQYPAYGIDPEAVAQVVNHLRGLVLGRSISWAKNTPEALRISFARRNSAFSSRSCFSSSRSELVRRSTRSPASASAWQPRMIRPPCGCRGRGRRAPPGGRSSGPHGRRVRRVHRGTCVVLALLWLSLRLDRNRGFRDSTKISAAQRPHQGAGVLRLGRCCGPAPRASPVRHPVAAVRLPAG